MATMLVWLGSGFAFAVGFILGLTVVRFASTPRDAQEEALKINRESLAALVERNEIGLRQAIHLERIADLMEIDDNRKHNAST